MITLRAFLATTQAQLVKVQYVSRIHSERHCQPEWQTVQT